ncbi:DNA circularization protein [Aeromonas sp. FDAARGOS 1408]|uniref:DNA circularization protein n=1 Tax=Aeromonas TaxID=642 RepID=UPI001C21C21A|nr:DNA circularization N-terminal domain-containing protein [Aeromonas sp. FDAARGOS 1408]QXC08719.1 DNA circularization N-terminal domain-containing protein [Aeromonas sp. FDAARGOS 1408]HDX8614915.1 DNA circularization N-terminal domain-containing protein [Aeromonas dhakensis]
MSWTDRLQAASFRGVAFKVDGDDLQIGRRTVIHEYPGRDTPSVEDMGRETREYAITAYLIGPDFIAERDRLIAALEQVGPGELVSPWYGRMNVVVMGKQRISHSKKDGRMCVVSFTFVESGEDEWPTATPLGSSLLAGRSTSLLDRAQSAFASAFGLDGLPEWMSMATVEHASALLGDVADMLGSADGKMSAAMRLMQGDLGVLMPPPSTAWIFSRRLADVLDAGKGSSTTARSLLSLSNRTATASQTQSARPVGVWPTSAQDKQQADRLTNSVSELVRVNLIASSAQAVALMPTPSQPTTTPARPPALDSVVVAPPAEAINTPTHDELEETRQTIIAAIDKESERTTDDGVYQALRDLRRELVSTLRQQQQHASKLVMRTPSDTVPALVLAAEWYDDASRADELIAKNNLSHPGFVPPDPLRTLAS